MKSKKEVATQNDIKEKKVKEVSGTEKDKFKRADLMVRGKLYFNVRQIEQNDCGLVIV